MANLALNRVAWTYTDHNGRTWRVSASLAEVSQGVFGGAAAAADVPGKPSGLRMRRYYVRGAAGQVRAMVAYEEGAGIATAGAACTVSYRDAVVPMVSTGVELPERQGRQTYQSA